MKTVEVPIIHRPSLKAELQKLKLPAQLLLASLSSSLIIATLSACETRAAGTPDLRVVHIIPLRGVSSQCQQNGSVDVRCLAAIEGRIKQHWLPPQGYEARTVSLDCKIGKAGKILDLRLAHSSGLPGDDQSALKAVTASQPFNLAYANNSNQTDLRIVFSALRHDQFVPHSLLNRSQPVLMRQRALPTDNALSTYLSYVNTRISRKWASPKLAINDTKVIVAFKVHSNGQLTNLRLAHASGFAVLDNASVQSIQKSAPFKPLPDPSIESIDAYYTFHYSGNRNVFEGTILGTYKK